MKSRIWGALIFFWLSIALLGCAEPDLPELPVAANEPLDLDKHIFEVDGRGEADTSNPPFAVSLEREGQNCMPQFADTHADPASILRQRFVCILDNALARYRVWTTAVPPRLPPGAVFKLAFYFNGGLNAREDAIQTAKQSYLHVEHDALYPIYMVWPTGALRTYGEDVAQVRAGRYTKWQDPWTLVGTPVRPVSDLARGIAGTPAAWGTSAHEFWQTGFGLGNQAYSMAGDRDALVLHGDTITAGRNLYFDYRANASGVVNADISLRTDGNGAEEVASYIYYGAMSPVRVLTTPLVLGFGEPGWRNMVRRTRTSVRVATEYPPELAPAIAPMLGSEVACASDPQLSKSYEKLQRCYPRGAGGFSRVFQWLESCITGVPVAAGADGCPLELTPEDQQILRNVRITMIGHSMGAIVVNELVQLYPDLPYEALVYMAAAASTRDTARAVTPILRYNQGCTKLYALMLHPLNESREPTGYGLLLSGSLLSYVDELLENPKTLPDRTFGQWHNLRMTSQLFPDDVQRWMFLHVFDHESETYRDDATGALKRKPNPTEHGAFNDENMPFWQESFWKPMDIQFAVPDRQPFAQSCEALFTGRLEAARLAAQSAGS